MSAAKAVRSEAADQQKKIIAGVLFALVAAGVLYFELSDPSPKAAAPVAAPATAVAGPAPAASASAGRSGAAGSTPAGNVVGPAARTVGNTSAALDPTLHMEAMLVTESVVYTGSGRNIFSGSAEAPPSAVQIPKMIAPGRTKTTGPVATVPSGPPPLPPIDLKFFGTATVTANGRRRAFLLHGDDVLVAAEGDIVQRKYKVISIGPNSIQMEDLTTNTRQTLPLLVTH